MTREKTLEEAKNIVCKDCNQQYGESEDSFGVIAGLWSQYLNQAPLMDRPLMLFPDDVACMMILFKVGCLVSGSCKHDTLADIIGYTACAEELMTKRERRKQQEAEYDIRREA